MPQGPIIKTPPTLSWRYQHWQGLVRGLNPQYLLVDGSTPRPGDEVEIVVRLGEGQAYELRGTWQASDPARFELSGERSLECMKDLLGQIRKVQHIDICNEQDVEAKDRGHGFARLHFMPEALPELDDSELDTSCSFLGKAFAAPLFITGMTGGVELGAQINRRLAAVAEKRQIPMGVGSQRIALENSVYRKIFSVKDDFPGVFLIGNLGFAQILAPDGVDLCRQAVEMIGADALAIHLNVLQECIQVEGDRHFKGALARLHEVCARVGVPVIVKEVGCGISPATAGRLIAAGVAAVDIAGRGGTSWGYIEGLRSSSPSTYELATTFRDWGIPTAHALAAVRLAHPELPVIATGGVRDGLTIAKACALGAQLVGVGLPLMRAAMQSEERVDELVGMLLRGLRITMLATGSRNLSLLRRRLVYDEPLAASVPTLVASFQHRHEQEGAL